MQANPTADRSPRAQPARNVVVAHPRKARSTWVLWLIVIVCALPFTLASALYFAPVWAEHIPGAGALVDRLVPDGKTNYGSLIDPQRPMPVLAARDLDGRALDLGSLRGRWIMVTVAAADCDEACVKRLYLMRQVRAAMGKEQPRVERLLLLTGPANIEPKVLAAYAGTTIARVDAAQAAAWLGTTVPGGAAPVLDAGRVFLVDPLGNLMLQWPADAQPARARKDLSRLLWASGIG